MRAIVILLTAIIISSCSQNKEENKINNRIEDTSIRMENLLYNLESKNLDSSTIEILVKTNETVKQQLDIYNDSRRSSISITSVSLNNLLGTTIISNNCDGITLQRRQKCFIDIEVDGTQLTANDYIQGFVVVDGENIPLNITVDEGVIEETPADISITPNPLDLGTVKRDASTTGILTISNLSRSSQDINVGEFDIEGFVINENTCPSTLARRKRCFINVGYNSPSEILLSELKTDTLLISGNEAIINVNLEADPIVDESCSINDPELTLTGYTLEGEQRVFDLTTLSKLSPTVRSRARDTKDLCINKNGLDELKVSLTGCDAPIARYRRCYMNIEKIEALDVNHEIFINGHSYIIKTGPDTPVCEEIDAQNNGYNISLYEEIIGQKDISGTDISQCSLTCPTGYSLDNTMKACVKQCDESSSLLNGVDPLNVTSYSGIVVGNDVSQCLVNSCSDGFNVSYDQKSCAEFSINDVFIASSSTLLTTHYDNQNDNPIYLNDVIPTPQITSYDWSSPILKDIGKARTNNISGVFYDAKLNLCYLHIGNNNFQRLSLAPNTDYPNDASIFSEEQCLIVSSYIYKQDLINVGIYPEGAFGSFSGEFKALIPIINNPLLVACEAPDAALNGYDISLYNSILGNKVDPDVSECSISCPANYSLTNKACIIKTQDVTVNKNGDGTITSNQSLLNMIVSDTTKTESFNRNTSISLTSVDGTDYVFVNWTGDVCNNSTNHLCSFSVSSTDIIVNANYNPRSCTTSTDVQNDNPVLTNVVGITNISGDYVNGCTYSCATGYIENTTNPSIACDEDLQPPVINFNITSTYTKNSTVGYSFSGSDIAETKIWEGTSCSGNIVKDWSSSSSGSVSIATLNSNNFYSAKARNEAGESTCSIDSVIHDNIIPVITVNSQNISGSSVSINWSVTDTNYNNTSYYLNNSYKGNTTSSNKTYNFTGMNFGTNQVRLYATDRASNSVNEYINIDYKPIPNQITVLEGDSGYHINITVRVNKLSGAGVKLYKDSACSQLVDTSTTSSSSYYDFSVEVGYTYGVHTFYAKQYSGSVESDCSTVFDSYESIEPIPSDRNCTYADLGFNSGEYLIVSGTVHDDGRGNLSNNTCSAECLFGSSEMGSSPNKYCSSPLGQGDEDKIVVGEAYNYPNVDFAILKNNGTVQSFSSKWTQPSTVSSGVVKIKALPSQGFVALKSNGTLVGWGESNLTNQLSNISSSGIVDFEATYYNGSITILKTDGTIESTEGNFNYNNANPDPINNPVESIHASKEGYVAIYKNGRYSHWNGGLGTYVSSINRPILGVTSGDEYFILMGSNKDFNGYTYSSNYYKVISDDTNSISGATGSNYYGFLGADESYGLISNSTNNPITAYGNTSDYSASGVDNPLTYTDVTMFSGGSFTDILYSRAAFALRRNSDLWIFGNAAFGGGSSNNITSINNVSQVKSGSIGFITVQSNGEAKMYAQGANPRTFSNGSVRTITVTSNCFGILNTSNLFSTYCSSYFNNSLSSSPVYEISNVSQVYSLDRAGFLLKKTNGTYEYLENHSGSQSIFPDPYPLTGITDSGGITENK